MPTCVATGCSNSSEKGVKVNNFPKDLERRKIWVTNCISFGGMSEFIPHDKSVLCEYHFTVDMWEKPRINGKKKLKCIAVPTIFGDLVYQVKGKIDKNPINNDNVDTEQIMVQINPLTKEIQLLSDASDKETFERKICQEKSRLLECSVYEDKQENINQIGLIANETAEMTCSAKTSSNQPSQGLMSNCRANEYHENQTSSIQDFVDDEYSDDDLLDKEKKLLNLHAELKTTSNMNLLEKYEKTMMLYEKSEKLRTLMIIRHKKKASSITQGNEEIRE